MAELLKQSRFQDLNIAHLVEKMKTMGRRHRQALVSRDCVPNFLRLKSDGYISGFAKNDGTILDILLSIPHKSAVSQVVGYIKGKSGVHLARVYGERRRNFVGHSFWVRGYFVLKVGRDETTIREYIQHQEAEDRRMDQTDLWR